MLGTLCSFSYFAVYIARNILSTVSPLMTEDGSFNTEQIGTLSSLFFIAYAVGQLINGTIGDKIKSKYMISAGLLFAGIDNLLFPLVADKKIAAFAAYLSTGFFLSMIYGPMVKAVSENTEPLYARRCSLGYTFSSFLGSPAAGILAVALTWQGTFFSGGAILVFMSIVCFTCFCFFERKGTIKYNRFKKEKSKGNVKVLIKHRIIRFSFVSIITGIVRTTVVFWLPTYLSQYLGFSAEKSALIFSGATFIISFTTFIAIFMYERLHGNINLSLFVFFLSAAVCFFAAFAIKQPTLNIIFMVLAIMSSNSSASLLWSCYCPSLYNTGAVSTATGFLDFLSYMAAAVSSEIFASAATTIGWKALLFVWFALMICGILTALPLKKQKALQEI